MKRHLTNIRKDNSPTEIENEVEEKKDKYSKKKRSAMKCSNVWDFFEKSNDRKLAKCRICKRDYKTSGNTSNLRDHLKRFHKNIQHVTEEQSVDSGTNNNNSATSCMRSISPLFKTTTLYDKECKKKKDIDAGLMFMIAADFQPFSIVNDEGFKNFVRILDPRYALPSKSTLRDKYLKTMYSSATEKLSKMLQTVKYVSVSCDSWTSRGSESYLSTNCHFINTNFELISVTLSTTHIMHHTSEAIANTLTEIFNKWDIKHKVICIVTDNAANMIKTAEILKIKHLPCYAHTLNLVVQDALEITCAQNIRTKCREIVKYFKSSTIAMDKIKSEQNIPKEDNNPDSNTEPYKLLQEVPTRWNSTLNMIKRIILLKEPLSRSLLQLKKAPVPFTVEEISLLQDMENILEMFDVATKLVSGSTYVTITQIVPITCGIYTKLIKIKLSLETEEGKLICDKLISSVTTGLLPYERRSIPRIATILDPRFKKDAFFSSINATEAANFLEVEMLQVPTNYGHCNDQQRSPKTTKKRKSNSSSLFSFLEERLSKKPKSSTADIIIHKRQYLEKPNASADTDPLLYWKMYSTPVKECILKYLCIPATSTESERVFSSTGTLISEKRTSLTAKNVDMLTFLNRNWKIVI